MAYSDDEDEEIIEYLTYPQNRTTDAQTQTWEKHKIDKVITFKPEPTLGTPAKNCHTPCKASDAIHKLTTHIKTDIAKRQVNTLFKITTTINHTENTTETLLYLNYHPPTREEHHEVIDLTREVTEIALYPMRQGRILEHWRRQYQQAMWNLQQKAAGKQPINLSEHQKAEANINKLIARLTKGEIIPHNWEFSYIAQHKPKERTTEYKFRFNQEHDIRCTEIHKDLLPHTREEEIDEWEKEIKAVTHNSKQRPPLTDRMEAVNKFADWLITLNRPAYGEKFAMLLVPSTTRHRAKMRIMREGGPLYHAYSDIRHVTIKITNKPITDHTIQEWKNIVINRLHTNYIKLENSIKIPSLQPPLNDNDDSDSYEYHPHDEQAGNPGGFQPLPIPAAQGFVDHDSSADEGYPG